MRTNSLSFWIIMFLLCATQYLAAQVPDKIKVACIGNSITYGYGLDNPDKESYPARLQEMLGNNYDVKNFGKSGATLLNKGHRPYKDQEEFQKAMEFAGDIAVIHLGVNDTDPRDWPDYRDYFVADYLALIDSCRKANPKVRVIVCRLTPIWDRHPRFESSTRDWEDEIQQAIETVAQTAQVQLTDLHEALYAYPHYFPDAIHPNTQGAQILAQTVYSAITGDFGGLKLSPLYSDNMVLQHNCPIQIQGTDNAGEKITVRIGNQTHTTITGTDGHWSVTLRPLTANENYTLAISDSKQKVTYHHVAAGEVWLCSGQSNMEFQLQQATTGPKDIPLSDNENIRLFDMKANWQTDNKAWTATALDSINQLQYYQKTKWSQCTPKTSATFSAIAYYFGKTLYDSLQVPIGLICNAIGGSPTEAWIDRSTIEHQIPGLLHNWPHNDYIQKWVGERALTNMKNSHNKLQRHPYAPCYLFETGIRPLQQFPIRGVIWYQGESNAHNVNVHRKLFKWLVASWRSYWEKPDMPFYYVQLSSLNRPSWTWFRDSQRLLMQEIPYTGMAVSSDKGDSLDVHPRDKKAIGERLARWALHCDYGYNLTPSGPLIRSARLARSNQVILDFDYSQGLRTSDGKAPSCFEIAEVDGLYQPATATIQGNQIILWSEQIRHPRFVRYGWQPFTRANLINEEGLPASTFRTEISR